VPDITDTQRDLQALDAELRKLEAEYNMYFAGRAPRPPWETRGRVETLFKRWSRTHVQSGVDRFRLDALQMRYRKFIELWDRAMRAREEGRPGPFAQRQATPPAIDEREQAPATKVLSVTSFTDPLREMDKLHALYDSLMEARRGVGESIVPFHKFAALVQERVGKLRQAADGAEVAFRVAVKDGKVSLTAKGLKRD
jgi:hypothetical protein